MGKCQAARQAGHCPLDLAYARAVGAEEVPVDPQGSSLTSRWSCFTSSFFFLFFFSDFVVVVFDGRKLANQLYRAPEIHFNNYYSLLLHS